MKSREIICTTILSVLVCFAFSPQARAACDSPDPGCPGGNLAEGYLALAGLTTGAYNTGIGTYALLSITDGSLCTGVGAGALFSNSAANNTATGAGALFSNTIGDNNTADGAFALFSSTTGEFNTAVGLNALEANVSGSGNTAIGDGAGSANTSGNFNTYVGFVTFGVNGESDTIRIGDPVNGAACFIGGIFGQTAMGGSAVFVDSNGRLGTVASSKRFKDGIMPMGKASEAVLALKPVSFQYKSDKTKTPQFGLVAEQVAEVNPDLVVRDRKGEIYSVRYDAVNAMLLNEFLKEHKAFLEEQRKVQEQQATITQLKKDFGVTIAQQQEAMEAVMARLNEQAAQIEKVSAQLEASKPAPQVVNNP
jgi:hypothetical protein